MASRRASVIGVAVATVRPGQRVTVGGGAWPRAPGRRRPGRSALGAVRSFRAARPTEGSSARSAEHVLVVSDVSTEQEDLGTGIRLGVIGAHEGLYVAFGQAFDDCDEGLAHVVLEGAA
jgi:hypothetical protein